VSPSSLIICTHSRHHCTFCGKPLSLPYHMHAILKYTNITIYTLLLGKRRSITKQLFQYNIHTTTIQHLYTAGKETNIELMWSSFVILKTAAKVAAPSIVLRAAQVAALSTMHNQCVLANLKQFVVTSKVFWNTEILSFWKKETWLQDIYMQQLNVKWKCYFQGCIGAHTSWNL
jgi:hypothetical protein